MDIASHYEEGGKEFSVNDKLRFFQEKILIDTFKLSGTIPVSLTVFLFSHLCGWGILSKILLLRLQKNGSGQLVNVIRNTLAR